MPTLVASLHTGGASAILDSSNPAELEGCRHALKCAGEGGWDRPARLSAWDIGSRWPALVREALLPPEVQVRGLLSRGDPPLKGSGKLRECVALRAGLVKGVVFQGDFAATVLCKRGHFYFPLKLGQQRLNKPSQVSLSLMDSSPEDFFPAFLQ